MKPRVLAFDTSAPDVSAAYFDGAKTRALDDVSGARHSDSLFKAIEKLLSKSGARLSDVDIFTVGLGPGSFTGLRVGVSCAKAFAYSLGKKLIGVSSLHAVGAAHSESRLRVVQDARRGVVFTASFAGGHMTSEPAAVPVADFLKTLKKGDRLAGTAIPIFKDEAERIAGRGACLGSGDTWRPRAAYLIPEALRRAAEKSFDDPMRLVPDYLFDQTCTVTPPKPRKRQF